MKLKDISYDKKTKEFKIYGEAKLFGCSAATNLKPEIILTRQEAIERGLDPDKKKGKGFFTKIQGIRVPINIEG